MSISVRDAVAHPVQILIANFFGGPLAGWILARGAAVAIDRPRSSARSMLWIACGFLAASLSILVVGGVDVLHPESPVAAWVANAMKGLFGVGVVVQSVTYWRWLGDASRTHPPLDWLIVVRVSLVVFLLTTALLLTASSLLIQVGR